MNSPLYNAAIAGIAGMIVWFGFSVGVKLLYKLLARLHGVDKSDAE